jgi:hypothetical protein
MEFPFVFPLNRMNQEIDKIHETYQKNVYSIQAKLNRAELQIKSLENLLEIKGKENRELMTICDNLIKKLDRAT